MAWAMRADGIIAKPYNLTNLEVRKHNLNELVLIFAAGMYFFNALK